jgi:tRNA(Ile)-lysidine synthase
MARDPAPVAVAFSGGGDSLALLIAAKAWGESRGRNLIALTVDHGLRPESADWGRFCQERAGALGVEHRILTWEGDKPATGVSAVARTARHRLLANAARDAGATVILVGHTADDRAEAALMRQMGSTTPSPRLWTPSPAWPEGRGIFLLRPLLGVRRSALRRALVALGQTWVDDPGNTDARSVRARARAMLAGNVRVDDLTPDSPIGPFADVAWGAAGDLYLPVRSLGDDAGSLRLLGAVCLCAAGSDRAPRRERLTRLMARLRDGDSFAATLAGARVESDGNRAHVVRDAGDSRGRALEAVSLPVGRAVVWDGRFEVAARSRGSTIGPLIAAISGLPPAMRNALAKLPPAVRRALPMVTHADAAPTLPTILGDPVVSVRPLAPARLAAACGAILDEAALGRMAKPVPPY